MGGRGRMCLSVLPLAIMLTAAVVGVGSFTSTTRSAQADTNSALGITEGGAAAAAPLTPQIDCNDPPPGERARLVDDAEMAIAYRGENHGLWYSEVNQLRDSGDLNWLYDVSCEVGPDGGCRTIKWPAIAMARDAEDRYRPVLAFRDSDKRVAFTVLTSDNSEFASHWYAAGSDVRGDDVRWIDIAAGNLDGPWTGDTDDEVAIAFSGNDHVLHLLALDPENLTPLEVLGYFWNSDDGRGNVQWTAVATGDLDGDGYDNEIVVAFRDGDGHLQVVIVRKPDEPGLAMELLWSKRWTDHDRDNLTERGYTDLVIDVATGDIDADWQDEVVVAFRDGSSDCWDCLAYGKVQLLVLDPTGISGGGWVVDDSVWITWDRIHFWSAASVSVAVADLDGDGTEEIALGCTIEEEDGYDSTWSHALRKYEYADGALVLQDDWRSPEIGRNFSPSTDAFRLALAAGDSNRDGRAEVVTAYRDTSFDLHLRIFDARNKIQLIEEMQAPSHVDDVREVALAMGDADLNALYGTYKGAPHCLESEESSVTAVIHSPPNWLEDESNHDEAAAGFGMNVGNGGGTGETVETTIGGSVTIKAVFEEIGPSVTTEWEGSMAHENVQMTTTLDGSEFETHPIWAYGEEGYWMRSDTSPARAGATSTSTVRTTPT